MIFLHVKFQKQNEVMLVEIVSKLSTNFKVNERAELERRKDRQDAAEKAAPWDAAPPPPAMQHFKVKDIIHTYHICSNQ